MTLVLVFVHWGFIGGMLLIKVPIEWSADYTGIAVLLVGIGSASVLTIFGRDTKVVEWTQSGPERIMRHPYLVLAAAAISNMAGMALLVRGQIEAASWAIGLSTVVMICEVSALVGSMIIRAHNMMDDGDRS